MFATAFQSNAFQNNAFQIYGGPEPTPDTHDGFTKDEIKRAKEIEKKLEKAKQKLVEAQKNYKQSRKQAIADLVDPQPVVKKQQQEVQSTSKEEALKPVIRANQEIKRLEQYKRQIELEVEARRQLAKVQHELALYQARKLAELDEEDALLVLLLS